MEFLDFFSKTTVNTLVSAIARKIKSIICEQILEAGMYSVEIDTTQDISVTDQCSLVVRYVHQGKVNERLLAVVPCHDTTGQGFHSIVQTILQDCNLKVEHCIADSTDGAANMQGKYNGFAAKMVTENKKHIHIWCHSHILNLVLSDIMKVNTKAASLFSLLNSIATFFKESHKRMNIWNSTLNDPKQKRLQTIAETRWWSKETALKKVFGSFDDPNGALYIDVIETLDIMANSNQINSDIRGLAKNHKDGLIKYENILTAQVFLQIFSITGPLSRYLQTKGLDLIKCDMMVQNAIEKLHKIQRDMSGVENATKKFLTWARSQIDVRKLEHIDIEENFPEKRYRIVKKFFDENASDEQPKSPLEKFKIGTYYVLLDEAYQAMRQRFSVNSVLWKDLALLNPLTFSEIKNSGLSQTSLITLSKKILKFNNLATPERLREEFLSFCDNWDKFKLTLVEAYNLEIDDNLFINVEHNEDSDETDNETNTDENKNVNLKERKMCQNCAICCYLIILKYNMYQEAYPVLATAYQYLLTIPISQVACERSFSILKYIKNRLRNRLADERLESFMVMNIEKNILSKIDNEELIDIIGAASTTLKNALIYQ